MNPPPARCDDRRANRPFKGIQALLIDPAKPTAASRFLDDRTIRSQQVRRAVDPGRANSLESSSRPRRFRTCLSPSGDRPRKLKSRLLGTRRALLIENQNRQAWKCLRSLGPLGLSTGSRVAGGPCPEPRRAPLMSDSSRPASRSRTRTIRSRRVREPTAFEAGLRVQHQGEPIRP